MRILFAAGFFPFGALFASEPVAILAAHSVTENVSVNTIQIRDPYILPVAKDGLYYLYGTTDKNCWGPVAEGFDVYSSPDLKTWKGPYAGFRKSADFWATQNFWAPECHAYKGRYFLFASFKADGRERGTQILVSDRPEGPFVPHSKDVVTPRDLACLDGTLHIDADGKPWMVFCHEWKQVGDGEMCAMRLTNDLSAAASEPVLLFKASSAPWAKEAKPGLKAYVTDGPFLYRTRNGRLLMLWSTVGHQGYTMGYAISESGTLQGPWRQHPEPLYAKDGGHGMIFRTFDGQLMMTLHHPNKTPNERAHFVPIEETEDGLLRVKAQ